MPKKKGITPETLGYRVKKARKAVKITAEELAGRIGMRVAYIEAIENDEITDVPADLLFRIARTLGTTISELTGLPVRTAPPGSNPGEPLHARKAR